MVNNAADYKEDVSKPSFVSQKMFSKNFIAIHEIKPVLRFEKTIYIEFCILSLNTWCMNSITNTLKANLMLDFYGDKHLFDFSDYLENWKFFDPFNTNIIGKMKDEFKRKNN